MVDDSKRRKATVSENSVRLNIDPTMSIFTLKGGVETIASYLFEGQFATSPCFNEIIPSNSDKAALIDPNSHMTGLSSIASNFV